MKKIRRTVVASLCALAWVGCANDTAKKDSGLSPLDANSSVDQAICRRPPTLSVCEAPPYGACKENWFCPGCNCSGSFKLPACNPATGDCRWFCTGCYPEEYTRCDQNASVSLLGLCGYCFNDSGPSKCDKLKAIMDAKSAGPHDAGGNS